MRVARWCALSALVIACGGNGDASDGGEDAFIDSAPDVHDASIDTPIDVTPDVPIDNWVAPLPPYARSPIVDYGGGRLLTSAKIVTVSFAGDDTTLIGRLQEFDDTITATPWWQASTSEYCEQPNGPCIGPGAGGGHVVLNETAAASYVDHESGMNSTIVQFIQSHITDGTFPQPDDQTIYVIFFPPGTNITLDGDTSCSSFGAYHYAAKFAVGDAGAMVDAAYAIEPRCNYGETFLTQAASHELIEAATDTDFTTGYLMQDESFCRYGCEVGDLCDHPWGSVYDTMTLSSYDGGAPYTLQRGWSNVSALAGHDPCVIPPSDHPYFNTAVESGMQIIYLGVGQSQTIELDGFADGTMSDWTIAAIDESNSIFGTTPVLGFSLDTTSMNDGKKAMLTITMNAKPQLSWVPYVIDNKATINSQNYEHQWGANVFFE
jgi:hypothetical protein